MSIAPETKLGESNVALEKDVFAPERREYIPTEAEWNKEKTTILVSGQLLGGSGGSDDFYTVPSNKILYITNINLSAISGTTAVCSSQITLDRIGSPVRVAAVVGGPSSPSTASLNYNMPIRVEEGKMLSLEKSNSAHSSVCVVQGFLVDKRISGR